MYQYGWLDEITQITEGGKVIRSFHNHMAGRLAPAYDGFNAEPFLRDELALNRRDGWDCIIPTPEGMTDKWRSIDRIIVMERAFGNCYNNLTKRKSQTCVYLGITFGIY